MTRLRPLSRFWRPMLSAAVLTVVLLFLGGCAGAAIGAGATAGIVALEERPLEVVALDTAIASKIRINLVNAGEKYIINVGIEVYEGRVLLTGYLPSEVMRAKAIRLTWEVAGVKDVFNELLVGETNIKNLTRESWITAQLTSNITLDKKILAINYSIETVGGTVYLIGLAQSQAELDRVVAHARNIGYVRNVISYVRVKKAPA